MEIGNWEFEGPYGESKLADRPGVYVVLDVKNDGSYNCIDVGESGKVATRIANHNRKRCWALNTEGQRAFAVLYTDDFDDSYRRSIEELVRLSMFLPCGES